MKKNLCDTCVNEFAECKATGDKAPVFGCDAGGKKTDDNVVECPCYVKDDLKPTKYDRLREENKKLHKRVAVIMTGLMVDEPKKHFYNADMTKCERTEPPATRPATPEEVREFIEWYFAASPAGAIGLKSGRVLRLKV